MYAWIHKCAQAIVLQSRPVALVALCVLITSGCVHRLADPRQYNKGFRDYRFDLEYAKKRPKSKKIALEGALAAANGYTFSGKVRGKKPELAAKYLQRAVELKSKKAITLLLECSKVRSFASSGCKFTALPPLGAEKARAHIEHVNRKREGYGRFWVKQVRQERLISFRKNCERRVWDAFEKKFPGRKRPASMVDPAADTSLVLYPEIAVESYSQFYTRRDDFLSGMQFDAEQRRDAFAKCSAHVEILWPGEKGLRIKEDLILHAFDPYRDLDDRWEIRKWGKFRGINRDQPEPPKGEYNFAPLYAGLAYVASQRKDLTLAYEFAAKSREAELFYKEMLPIWAKEKAAKEARRERARVAYAEQRAQERRANMAAYNARKRADNAEADRRRKADMAERVSNMYSKKNNPYLKAARRREQVVRSVSPAPTRTTRRSSTSSTRRSSSRRSSSSRTSSPTAKKTRRRSTRPDPVLVEMKSCLKGGHKWEGTRCIRTWNIKNPGRAIANSGRTGSASTVGSTRAGSASASSAGRASSSGAAAAGSSSSGGTQGKEMGPVMLEALAYCWEEAGKWFCHGTTQKLVSGERDIGKALSRAGCLRPSGSDVSGSGRVYFCGRGLKSSDDDIAAIYGVSGASAARRKTYQCERYKMGHCTTVK
jgi:hypothetical protein